MVDKLDEDIQNINDCAETVSNIFHDVLTGKRDPSPEEGATIVRAATFIAATLAIRATETAHSVGRLATALEKLVEINERDFKAAVNAEADVKSDMKREEETKRSFIGQKRN